MAPKDVPSVAEFTRMYARMFRVSEWESAVIAKLLRDYPTLSKPVLLMSELDVLFIKNDLLSRVKASTVQKYTRLLRRALKKARTKWGYKGLIDPFEDIGLKVVEARRERVLLKVEYEQIRKYLLTTRRGHHPNELPKLAYLDLIDWAVETAMRRGEIAKIRPSHINEDFTTCYIPETKTNKPRTIPLSPRAQVIIRRRLREETGPLLFPIKAKTITKRFTYMCRTLALKDLHFHDLRHTALSRYDRMGFSKGMLKLIGGHETDKMLNRYLHADLSQTLERMQELC